jgi:hypothetical protein
MDANRLWMHLNELAGQLGVEVRLEALADDDDYAARGGLCRLGQRLVAFVDRRLSPEGRNRQLGQAIKGLEVEGVYLRPAVREFLLDIQKPSRHEENEDWPD